MKYIWILGHKWIHMDSDQNGFTDSFNFEKMYSYSSCFNIFGFAGPKIKSIRIRRDIDISQFYDWVTTHFLLQFRSCDECSEADNFPEETVEEAENYCRNPTHDVRGEWCFIAGSNEKGYCDIPDCNQGKQFRKILPKHTKYGHNITSIT